MAKDTEPAPESCGALAGGGLLAGMGAVIGASCCVLPILLVQAGASAALVTHLGVFTHARPYLIVVATVLVAAGFVASFWGGRRPSRWVLVTLIAAAVLIAASVVLPYQERFVLDWIRGR